MNSATEAYPKVLRLVLALGFGVMLGAAQPVAAQETPLPAAANNSASESDIKATEVASPDAAQTAEITPAKPGELDEKIAAESAPEVTDAEAQINIDKTALLSRLQSGSKDPLTLADLAALNDMMKRVDYLNALEKKMSEMSLGGGGSSVPLVQNPGTSSILNRAVGAGGPLSSGGQPGSAASAAAVQYYVLRIVGTAGSYRAVILTSNNTQVQVEAGDYLGDRRVASISVNGVRTSGPGGIQELPFVSTSGIAGVSTLSRPGR